MQRIRGGRALSRPALRQMKRLPNFGTGGARRLNSATLCVHGFSWELIGIPGLSPFMASEIVTEFWYRSQDDGITIYLSVC